MPTTRDRLNFRFVVGTIGTTLVNIVLPTAVGGFKTVVVHVENTGGSNFSAAEVQVAPVLDLGAGDRADGVGTDSSYWRVINTATFGSLAGGTGTTMTIADNAYQYLRVRARVAAGSTSGTAWLFGGGW